MQPMNIFFGAMIFVAAIISGTGFYGGLVNDYSDIGATTKINTSDYGDAAVLDELNNTQSEMESSLKTGIESIPIIGTKLVLVFSTYQIIKGFFLSMWDAVTIGSLLITGLDDIIPYVIHPTIISLIQMAIVFMFIGSMIYLLIGRRPD